MRPILVFLIFAFAISAIAEEEIKAEKKIICEKVVPHCRKHATFNKCGPNPFCFKTCGWDISNPLSGFNLLNLNISEVHQAHLVVKDAILDVSVTKVLSWMLLMENASELKIVSWGFKYFECQLWIFNKKNALQIE